MKVIGKGLSCSSKSEAIGDLVYVTEIEDVIQLFDSASGKICLVNDAGITTLGPILSDLAGTICTTGGAGSHLAILSREFGIPCIMGTKFNIDISSVIGMKIKLSHNGDNHGYVHLLD